MQLHHVALKGASHHPFAQAFEAVHFGLRQAAREVTAPDFPETPPEALVDQHRFVSMT